MIKTFQSMGSSSWADDDEIDTPTTYAAKPAPAAAPIREEVVIEEEERRDEPARNSGRQYDDHEAGGRGGRGRRNSGDNYEHKQREKLPVPDHGPFKSYVGNLPYSMSEDDLADYFEGCTVTDVRIPIDYSSGRPKGFAYIEFGDRESLVRALEYDGKTIDKRAIRVDVAGEKKSGGRDGAFFQKRDGGDRYGDRGGNDRYNDRGGNDRFNDRSGGRGDNYGDRRGGDRYNRDGDDRRAPRTEREHAAPAASAGPVERPKLSLLPRTKSKEEADNAAAASRANPFGDAKPRDERAVKPAADRAPRQDVKTGDRQQGGGRGGRGDKAAGGRGDKGGRGDGKPTRSDGEWTRGGASVEEKKAPKAKPAKSEKKPVEAPVFKPAAQQTKTVNAFSALGGDDSDSD
ncbi:Aste57867_10073 [Aphanomyces stellatus]|uniref:Aste57867_10073 protein n=1 Tax=Aphanomyces stellatus TaxID=120398 RepID=A0A485KPF6_9STRA|nr:hypothetical protein As57867_010034 [Aphanomyces stellatus]VFT86949.1 Aste57867_10073 [Aphanomyces stellatus]